MKIYLDLLPQERKNELKRTLIFRYILREEIIFLLPILVFIIILANIYYILNFQHNNSVAINLADKSQDKYQELHSYEEKFSKVNDSVSVLTKIQSNHLHWKNVLMEITKITPDGIIIKELSTKNYQVFLLGKAKSREYLLTFKNQLEKSSCFENINVPLSNLVVKDDVDFQMDFMINKDCLKNGY